MGMTQPDLINGIGFRFHHLVRWIGFTKNIPLLIGFTLISMSPVVHHVAPAPRAPGDVQNVVPQVPGASESGARLQGSVPWIHRFSKKDSISPRKMRIQKDVPNKKRSCQGKWRIWPREDMIKKKCDLIYF